MQDKSTAELKAMAIKAGHEESKVKSMSKGEVLDLLSQTEMPSEILSPEVEEVLDQEQVAEILDQVETSISEEEQTELNDIMS